MLLGLVLESSHSSLFCRVIHCSFIQNVQALHKIVSTSTLVHQLTPNQRNQQIKTNKATNQQQKLEPPAANPCPQQTKR